MKAPIYIIIIIIIIILTSCNSIIEKEIKPDWVSDLTDIDNGQLTVSINNDTIILSSLINYTYLNFELDSMLHSNTKIIFEKDWNYEDNNFNILVFDSLTYHFSTKNGNSIGQIINYKPFRDIFKYPQNTCWNNCNPIKLAMFGCNCKFNLLNDYNGFKIVLSYYTKHFKEETHPQKLSFLVYKNNELIRKYNITNYNNFINGNIRYFISNDAIYFFHYYNNEKKISSSYLAKFSFNNLIPPR